MTTPILTADADEFRTHLWPGDILVFDSVGLDAGLVQWGDNIPANHVSIVIDDKDLFEANREHEGEGDVDAVRPVDIGERLVWPTVRTTTALRHINVSDEADPRTAAAVAWAKSQNGTGDFAYLATTALGPLAFHRSFGDELNKATWMSDPLRAIFDRALSIAKALVLANKCALSCSEFVYRCYDEGTDKELTVAVTNPLMNQHMPSNFAAAQDELVRELEATMTLCQFGRPWSSIADWVTPGDFLRSTSLRQVAVMHRLVPTGVTPIAPVGDPLAAI